MNKAQSSPNQVLESVVLVPKGKKFNYSQISDDDLIDMFNETIEVRQVMILGRARFRSESECSKSYQGV